MGAEAVAAWLVTFAVHGTALLGTLWLLGPWLRRLSDGVQEAVLRFALLAPLVSATLQVTLVPEPAAGHLANLALAPPSTSLSTSPGPSPEVLQRLLSLPLDLPAASGDRVAPAAVSEISSGAATAVPEVAVSPWSWLVLAAGLAAWFGILYGIRLRFKLWRILRRRRPVNGGPIATELTRIQRLAGLRRRVRLSICDSLHTPIAFGVVRPEISLPTRALRMDAEHRTGMLAHELAHVARRDPLWLWAIGFIERVFCWQPLIRLVRKRLRELAEFRADAWAARHTGGLSMARCLVVVADWVAQGPRPVRLVPGMAQGESNLKSRIDRLLEGGPQAAPRGIWTVPIFAGLLVAMTSALPGAAIDQGPRPYRLPPSRVDADAGAEEPEPLPELLTLLQHEREILQGEVEALYAELPPDPDPELMALMQQLHQRLESVDRRRMQLLDWLLERERNH